MTTKTDAQRPQSPPIARPNNHGVAPKTIMIPRVGPIEGHRLELIAGGPDALIDERPHRHVEHKSTASHRAYARAVCVVCGHGLSSDDVLPDGVVYTCGLCN